MNSALARFPQSHIPGVWEKENGREVTYWSLMATPGLRDVNEVQLAMKNEIP